MTVSSSTTENLLTKTFQAGLWVAMPATLYVLGGPIVIWNEGGTLVKIFLFANVLPSAICAAGVLEGCVRTAWIGLNMSTSSSNTQDAIEFIKKNAWDREVRRTTGMIRATLFPISGWGVLAQLPVNDYYVYIIPKKAIKKTGSAVIRVAKEVNNVLVAIKFWEGVNYTIDHTLVPIGNHVVKPIYDVVGKVANGAINLLRTSLGMR